MLLLVPRLTDMADSTSIYFRRLASGLEEHGCEMGVVHGRPPGWGESGVPAGWWEASFAAPRRKNVPKWASPLVRLAAYATPYKGGVLHRRQALEAVARGVEGFRPDVVLCHDFPVLMEAASAAAPERTCLWLVEPSPLQRTRGLLRGLRDRRFVPWWRRQARGMAWLASNLSGPPLAALEKQLGRRVLSLFPGVPARPPEVEVLPRIGFFGNLGARMRAWLGPRLGALEEAAGAHGLGLHFHGLRKADRRWVEERAPGASLPGGFLEHGEVVAQMAACRLLMGIGVSSVQGTGKVQDYLGAGRPVLYFGYPESADARLLATHGAGVSFGWEARAEDMEHCLAAALAVKPGPPPSGLAPAAQAANLLSWVGGGPGPLP